MNITIITNKNINTSNLVIQAGCSLDIPNAVLIEPAIAAAAQSI